MFNKKTKRCIASLLTALLLGSSLLPSSVHAVGINYTAHAVTRDTFDVANNIAQGLKEYVYDYDLTDLGIKYLDMAIENNKFPVKSTKVETIRKENNKYYIQLNTTNLIEMEVVSAHVVDATTQSNWLAGTIATTKLKIKVKVTIPTDWQNLVQDNSTIEQVAINNQITQYMQTISPLNNQEFEYTATISEPGSSIPTRYGDSFIWTSDFVDKVDEFLKQNKNSNTTSTYTVDNIKEWAYSVPNMPDWLWRYKQPGVILDEKDGPANDGNKVSFAPGVVDSIEKEIDGSYILTADGRVKVSYVHSFSKKPSYTHNGYTVTVNGNTHTIYEAQMTGGIPVYLIPASGNTPASLSVDWLIQDWFDGTNRAMFMLVFKNYNPNQEDPNYELHRESDYILTDWYAITADGSYIKYSASGSSPYTYNAQVNDDVDNIFSSGTETLVMHPDSSINAPFSKVTKGISTTSNGTDKLDGLSYTRNVGDDIADANAVIFGRTPFRKTTTDDMKDMYTSAYEQFITYHDEFANTTQTSEALYQQLLTLLPTGTIDYNAQNLELFWTYVNLTMLASMSKEASEIDEQDLIDMYTSFNSSVYLFDTSMLDAIAKSTAHPLYDVSPYNPSTNNDIPNFWDETQHKLYGVNVGTNIGTGNPLSTSDKQTQASALSQIAIDKLLGAYYALFLDGFDSTSQDCLEHITDKYGFAKLIWEHFHEYYPELDRMYTEITDDHNVTLQQFLEDFELTDLDMSISGLYEGRSNVSSETILGKFYYINTDNSFGSYNRSAVLRGRTLDTTPDDSLSVTLVEKFNWQKYLEGNGLYEDIFEDDNINDVSTVTELYDADAANTAAALTTISDYSQSDEAGDNIASTSYSVIISDYIRQGMQYSATYIPMQTNIYAQNLIASYDEDFRDNFFYQYGFMRKALYRDTSGTAAVDYYNSGGTSTGHLEICTLRDILEIEDNDLVLYIDNGFYNADTAIEQGNALLKQHLNTYSRLEDALLNIVNTMAALEGEQIANRITEAIKMINPLYATIHLVKDIFGVEDGNDPMDPETYFEVQDIDVFSRYNYSYKTALYSTEYEELLKDVGSDNADRLFELAEAIVNANIESTDAEYTEQILKTKGYSGYDDMTIAKVSRVVNSQYIDLDDTNDLSVDNIDSIVMSSSDIKEFLDSTVTYKSTREGSFGNAERYSIGRAASELVNEASSKISRTVTESTYTSTKLYNPMMSLAFVSLLYRDADYYTLANMVADNNPVFMASDDLCGVSEEMWYANSLLNYALVRNLKANVQVDYTYCIDLDCPVYMDIFGNILTESGTVVIPAACNATLHTADFSKYNFAQGLYSVYGKIYTIPLSCTGAANVLSPFLIADLNAECYVINAITFNVNGKHIRFDKTTFYDTDTKEAMAHLYGNSLLIASDTTSMNWIAMVNIINEVLRGAPIEFINKDKESLYSGVTNNYNAAVAAVKYEALLESLNGSNLNTLMALPSFTKMDGIEYYIAFMIKMVMVATVAVIIVLVYRDGVAGSLGFRTILKALSAIGLTVSVLVATPLLFQFSYYGANKILLEKESYRILMLNEEKRQVGVEIGMTNVNTHLSDDNFEVQLDYIKVPWYNQVENVVYGNSVRHVSEVKKEAYMQTPVYQHLDIVMHDDGVYSTTNTLFDSARVGYTWNGSSTGAYGLYLYGTQNQDQTAGFYMPYYVFLKTLVANVNEYNQGRSLQDVSSYAYATKVLSGNRLATVGLCYNYFNSDAFLNEDTDIMRLCQIYMSDDDDYLEGIDEDGDIFWQSISREHRYALAQKAIHEKELISFNRSLLYSPEERDGFRKTQWYNDNAVFDFEKRVEAMDNYAKDFIANNHDLMLKVSDETFLKVMALYMAIKYNQLFGTPSANTLEISNLDATDLLRLCILDQGESSISAAMSFPRFVYNYGGAPSVYAAAILSMLLWVGSFVKPLCIVIAFLSIFLSIWVFRVVLRKPSANIVGYLTTLALICFTNVMHAVILKIGLILPQVGLSMLGCLIFLIVGQILYMLALSYVTGVALKDWSNLGATEYEREANIIKSKFKKTDESGHLDGKVPHHDDNWDYYNSLVDQHRARNAT